MVPSAAQGDDQVPAPGRYLRQTVGAAALLAVLMTVSAALAIESLRGNAITLDEYAHVPAGVGYWQRGSFFLYRENPPFVRLLVALPVWLAGARTNPDLERDSLGSRSEWLVAEDFERVNSQRYVALFVMARLVVVALSVVCGILIFVWARGLYGDIAGVACAALWYLDPSVLAHSGIATPDVGAAAFGTVATFLYWRFLRHPGWLGAVASGIGLGLAQASKFSMLVLYPAWALMAICASTQQPEKQPHAGRRWVAIAASFAVGLLVLNVCYLFEGSFKKLGSYHFISRLLAGNASPTRSLPTSNNRFRTTPFGQLPVPLPRNYVQGFDSEKWDEEVGLTRVEHGRLVLRGNYFSPLVTLLYKLPLGTLALLLASAGWLATRPCSLRRPGFVVAIPGLLLIAVLSGLTGLNWAVRYALPALPFLFIGVGDFVRVACTSRAGRLILAACFVWNLTTLAGIRPYYLSFGNEFTGGASRAMRELNGSNYDWGQDLIRLKHWCDAHPEASPMILAYYGMMSPELIGLPPTGRLPDELLDGGSPRGESERSAGCAPYYCAVSATYLIGMPAVLTRENGERTIARFRLPARVDPDNPYAKVGSTIRVYRIDP